MEHINESGNYTRLSTDDFRVRLASWGSNISNNFMDFSTLSSQEKVDLILQLAQDVSNDADNSYTITVKVDGEDDIDVIQITAGVDYKLGKKTKVFSYLGMVEEEKDNTTSDTEEATTFAIGMEHKF